MFPLAFLFIAVVRVVVMARHHACLNFYMVTTTCSSYNLNSSLLRDVSATSLFDPYKQETHYLRLIDEGYNELPRFNLSGSRLHSWAPDPTGLRLRGYSSGMVLAQDQLEFSPNLQAEGNLDLKDGYLLAVNGETSGWTVCDGDLGQRVVFWKGTDVSCEPRFIHAIAEPPY